MSNSMIETFAKISVQWRFMVEEDLQLSRLNCIKSFYMEEENSKASNCVRKSRIKPKL